MTPPGKRQAGRENWPDNLYAKKTAKGLWFYYRRPDLPAKHKDRDVGLGYIDEKEAIDAAEQANRVFGKGRDAFAKISGRGGITLDQYIDIFIDTHLKDRRSKGEPLSADTMKEFLRYYRNIKESELRGVYLRHDSSQAEIVRDQGVIAKYLNSLSTPEVFNKYRTRLIDLYKYAVNDGLTPENIPARILPKSLGHKVRQRIATPDKPGAAGQAVELSMQAYDAIFEKASPPIKVAMELALNVMQRRSDIQRWRYDWSHDDKDGRHVYIIISKTKKHGQSSYIRIPESLPLVHSGFGCRTLGELIAQSRKENGAVSLEYKHLVHEKPKRVKKSAEKEHAFQLSRKQISDGFAAARDASGIYEHLQKEQRPTLHELIATGEYLRKAQGWTVEDIQQFRGHTKAKTTKTYLEGHEYKTAIVPMDKAPG